nr:cysteine peptidase family C39 domain-containing protein [Elizabethkingia meningoseptica]MEC4710207.1 cysteine peptidase family C39 domain-containing protein [Elizabethkingia meningoseptica]
MFYTLKEFEEVILAGKKPQSIFNILSNARIGFKKLGIEIVAKIDGYLLKWKDKPIFKGDFKEVNVFWHKILKPKLGTGTGDLMKYLEIISNDMIRQEHNMSCAAACIKQLAKDNGIEMTEEAIREFARTSEEMGTFPDGILDGLRKVFKDKEILDRTFIRNPDNLMPLILEDISKEGSWIGIVLLQNGNYHVVIVDKIVDGKVFVRDPWPPEGIGKGKGIEAVIGLDEFADSWLRGGASSYHVK